MNSALSRRGFLKGVAGAAAIAGTSRAAAQFYTPPPRNLLLITADMVRADHLPCYGYRRGGTPALTRLAEEGLCFDNANTQHNIESASLASIQTGLPPIAHGVYTNETALPEAVPTIASALKAQDYACAGFLGFMKNQQYRGFDVLTGGRRYNDAEVAAMAVDWLNKQPADAPFYAWVHFHGPALPWQPMADCAPPGIETVPEELGTVEEMYRIDYTQERLSRAKRRAITRLYDADLHCMDAQAGRLLETLDARRQLDNTLVVFAGAFGVELGDHHNYMLNWASPYHTVYRVPLLMRLPGVAPAGMRIQRAVQAIDIAPTVLSVLGAAAPDAAEGTNLWPLVARPDYPRAPVASEYLESKALVLCADRYRYIYNPAGYRQNTIPQSMRDQFEEAGLEARGGRMPLEERELYDIVDDPLERRNLVHRRPEVRDAMEAALKDWAAAHGWTPPEPTG